MLGLGAIVKRRNVKGDVELYLFGQRAVRLKKRNVGVHAKQRGALGAVHKRKKQSFNCGATALWNCSHQQVVGHVKKRARVHAAQHREHQHQRGKQRQSSSTAPFCCTHRLCAKCIVLLSNKPPCKAVNFSSFPPRLSPIPRTRPLTVWFWLNSVK